MRALLIACSRTACERMLELKEKWEAQEPETELICKVKCAALPGLSEKRSLKECVGEWFSGVDAIVFLCAAGIAVRSIAPWIAHKGTDPAVIVMDETLRYCIPVLSGHWGGGNALAQKLSRMTGALPVITTATDREGKFAVDVFAKQNGLLLDDWKLAKRISARILEGERFPLCCDFSVEGKLPPELWPAERKTEENPAGCSVASAGGRTESIAASAGGAAATEGRTDSGAASAANPADRAAARTGIAVSCRASAQNLFEETLQLIPRAVVVGVGCRKGTSREKIEAAVSRCLAEADIRPEALCAAASIDLKKEEEGLLAWCAERKLPFLTCTAEQLGRTEGNFSESAFVEAVTGVSNVCERSAVAAAEMLSGGGPASAVRQSGGGGSAAAEETPESGGRKADAEETPESGEKAVAASGSGSLICRKRIYDGVTAALAIKKVSVKF